MSGQRTQTSAHQTPRGLFYIRFLCLLGEYRSTLDSGSLANTGSHCASHHYYYRYLPHLETQARWFGWTMVKRRKERSGEF